MPRPPFPRSARVRARSEFTEVFDRGRRVAHPLLSLHWLSDARAARLGLAVSRKVDPHAVGRNRIKRILRDDFRHRRAELARGAYVVVARPAAPQADACGRCAPPCWASAAHRRVAARRRPGTLSVEPPRARPRPFPVFLTCRAGVGRARLSDGP